MDFSTQLEGVQGALERYVRFRIARPADAEDVLQEIRLSAYRNYPQLRDPERFKPWILAIARARCHDYYRRNAGKAEVSLDAIEPDRFTTAQESTPITAVEQAMEHLNLKDQQLLTAFYFRENSLAEIAAREGIPVGTVKSRLHYARERFRTVYLALIPSPEPKGGIPMNRMPTQLPNYSITLLNDEPFPVVWEELLGWMIVPRLGEKLHWGIYDWPARTLSEETYIEAVGEAEVHGIRGVELRAVQTSPKIDPHNSGLLEGEERRFIAQLTDSHCRYLAESHMEDGVRKCYTYLDGDEFLQNWGYGEDNCGSDIHPQSRGLIRPVEGGIECDAQKEVIDVVGCYQVTIGSKSYKTVRVVFYAADNDDVVTEQYLDEKGRTVLWRRFNQDRRKFDRYSKRWSELLPDNERMTVNGQTYVHWYDCITDYIL